MLAQITLPNSTNVRNAMKLTVTRVRMSLATAFAPATAVDAAARLFLTPPRHAHSTVERELLATGRGYTVDTPRARLAAWRFGAADAPAVILSHGWGGRGAQLRHFVQPLLDAGYQVITFDHAAHGYSEGREASIVHFIQGIEAVVEDARAKGLVVAGLVGHSLGAASIGAWLKRAASRPGSAGARLRVVLVAPPNSVARYASRFARYLGLPERIRNEMQERVERRFGAAWSEFELPGSVAGIEAAALVIHDADDRDVPFASGLSIARAWRDARFVRTEGLGHRAVLRDAQVVRDAVDFLRAEVVFPRPPEADRVQALPAPIY